LRVVGLVAVIALAIAAVWLYRSATAPAEAPPDGPSSIVHRPSPEPHPAPVRPPSDSALPDHGPSAIDHGPDRAELLSSLKSSGSAHEPWDDQARTLLNGLASDDAVVTFNGCYTAGCGATVIFPTRDAYDRIADDVARGSAFRAWTGGKKWSAPEATDDGRIAAVLILYRPD